MRESQVNFGGLYHVRLRSSSTIMTWVMGMCNVQRGVEIVKQPYQGHQLSCDHVSRASCAERAWWTGQYLITVDFCFLVTFGSGQGNRGHTMVSTLYQWNCLPPITHHKRSPLNLKSMNIMRGHLPGFNFFGLTDCVSYTMATLMCC